MSGKTWKKKMLKILPYAEDNKLTVDHIAWTQEEI